MILSHDQESRYPYIWEKPFKNLLQNQWTDFCEVLYEAALGIQAHHSNDPWLTLTYFKAVSNFVTCFSIANKGFFRNFQPMTRESVDVDN